MKWRNCCIFIASFLILAYSMPGRSAQDMDGDYVPETPASTQTSTGTSTEASPPALTEEQQKLKETQDAGRESVLKKLGKALKDKDGFEIDRPVDQTQELTETQRRVRDAAMDRIKENGLVSQALANMFDPKGQKKPSYDRRTNDGDKGCAQIVAEILAKAGALKSSSFNGSKIVSCDTLRQALEAQGYKIVRIPPETYKAGDVVQWGQSVKGEIGRHVGVLVENGNNAATVNNDSARKRVKVSTVGHRLPEWVMRKA